MEEKFISFEEAKKALITYFSNEPIEDFGFSQEEFDSFIDDFDSPLYDVDFIRSTALGFDYLSKVGSGFVAEY